jgi:hypothetical protein
MIGAFGAVVVLCLGATAVALRVGLRRVELMEF